MKTASVLAFVAYSALGFVDGSRDIPDLKKSLEAEEKSAGLDDQKHKKFSEVLAEPGSGPVHHPSAQRPRPHKKPAVAGGQQPPAGMIKEDATCLKHMPFADALPVDPNVTAREVARVKDDLHIYMYKNGFHQVARSAEYMDLCLSLFPDKTPIVFHVKTAKESQPVCMLASTEKRGVQPVFWSDYNSKRKIPNFVAYINRAWEKPKQSRTKWKALPGFSDAKYGIGPVKLTAGSHCEKNPDIACTSEIATRGHLATFSHLGWDLAAASATMTYINTVPSRQPFDGNTWNVRERWNDKYAKEHGDVYVVKGPSLEIDGKSKEGVEVPAMLWAALYDPKNKMSKAWAFRNGLDPNSKNCKGADDLKVSRIERALGQKLWHDVTDDQEIAALDR